MFGKSGKLEKCYHVCNGSCAQKSTSTRPLGSARDWHLRAYLGECRVSTTHAHLGAHRAGPLRGVASSKNAGLSPCMGVALGNCAGVWLHLHACGGSPVLAGPGPPLCEA